jgi:hypothetical protein
MIVFVGQSNSIYLAASGGITPVSALKDASKTLSCESVAIDVAILPLSALCDTFSQPSDGVDSECRPPLNAFEDRSKNRRLRAVNAGRSPLRKLFDKSSCSSTSDWTVGRLPRNWLPLSSNCASVGELRQAGGNVPLSCQQKANAARPHAARIGSSSAPHCLMRQTLAEVTCTAMVEYCRSSGCQLAAVFEAASS